MLSPAQQEIRRQVAAQLPAPRGPLQVRCLYDEQRPNWLQVNLRRNGRARNVTITYLPVPDLYDLELHDLVGEHGIDLATRTYERVYCDQLGELMALPHTEGRRPMFTPRELPVTATVTDWEA